MARRVSAHGGLGNDPSGEDRTCTGGAGLGISGADATGALIAAGIEPSRRAETLSLAEWAALAAEPAAGVAV